ncbi:unnamed protein product [Ectocarpus sp. 12 AP-2014]
MNKSLDRYRAKERLVVVSRIRNHTDSITRPHPDQPTATTKYTHKKRHQHGHDINERRLWQHAKTMGTRHSLLCLQPTIQTLVVVPFELLHRGLTTADDVLQSLTKMAPLSSHTWFTPPPFSTKPR